MADLPARIQLRRTKGWRMPPGAVKVDRSTIWGNPFATWVSVDLLGVAPHQAQADVVARFRLWLDGSNLDWSGPEADAARDLILSRLPELQGKPLACWCKPGEPCHADVLIDLANNGLHT